MISRFEQIKKHGLIGDCIDEHEYKYNGLILKTKTYDLKNTIYKEEDNIDSITIIDIDFSKSDWIFKSKEWIFKSVKKIVLDKIIGLSFSINQAAVESRYNYLLTVNKSTLIDIEIPILKDRIIYYIHLDNITDIRGIDVLKTILRRYTNRFKHSKVGDCPNLSPLLTAISWFVIRPYRKTDV